ncbi:hypothetical protein QYE76_063863 [Lolium multiflorum]|uniref:Uncharacterized protein n=1 Tax=Lolium multiflorum TaxID=4521 RepID=A0AAD8S6J3_LOLMU|nr:hypothetical protein QYE76_063863 [Lolium multiflorum]
MQALPVVLNKRLRFSAVFKGDILFLVNFCAILFPILAEQEPQRFNLKMLTCRQRKASLVERLNALNSSAGAVDDDEDDDE